MEKVLVTLPGIHATQRLAYVEELNQQRQEAGQPALSPPEAERILANSVNLYFEADRILIRPDPDNLALAFEADEVLQTLTSKRHIKYLQATNQRVMQAIKQRGEVWRISPLPQSPQEIRALILNARTAIGGEAIYYQNRFTGTRFLTCDAFRSLGRLPPAALAGHLREIQEFAPRQNRLGQPEIAFFQAPAFNAGAFAAWDFQALDAAELRRVWEELEAQFTAAVPAEFQRDNVEAPHWQQAMFNALIGQREETVADEILQGLSPEYFLQLQWLPGCRIAGGEILFDPGFAESPPAGDCQNGAELCDPKTRSFIFNAVREYGELEYVNVARIPSSLSRRAAPDGRRGVFLAELKLPRQPAPVVRVIRMQKWDVAGHLDYGKDLLGAMLEAAEYTDYVLDRRLACRQLGMNLPPRIQMHRLSEVYDGPNERYRGQIIWSTYFERDYCPGLATDKIAAAKLGHRHYALCLARLLGRAAAPNLIVGRQDLHFQVLFDDGDEIVREENGLPVEIVVADATGAFADYAHPLDHFARHYAQPVNRRWPHLAAPEEFAAAYLAAFIAEFERIQAEYAARRGAFDGLFRHYKQDPQGSLGYRWKKVLERLEATDATALAARIRDEIGPN